MKCSSSKEARKGQLTKARLLRTEHKGLGGEPGPSPSPLGLGKGHRRIANRSYYSSPDAAWPLPPRQILQSQLPVATFLKVVVRHTCVPKS